MHQFYGMAVVVSALGSFYAAMSIMLRQNPRWITARMLLSVALACLAGTAGLTGMQITRDRVQYRPDNPAEVLAEAAGLTLNHKLMTVETTEPGTEIATIDTTYAVEVETVPSYSVSVTRMVVRLSVSAGDFPRISHSLLTYRNGWLVFMVPGRSPARYFRPANVLDSCRAEINREE